MRKIILAAVLGMVAVNAYAVSPTALQFGTGQSGQTVGDIYPANTFINSYALSAPTVYVSATVSSSTIGPAKFACFAASVGCDINVRANGTAPIVSSSNVTNGSAWMKNPQKCLSTSGVSYFALQSDQATASNNCVATMSVYK